MKSTSRGWIFVLLLASFSSAATKAITPSPLAKDDFYPAWASSAANLRPLAVRDTDSAIGRRNLLPKLITLKDMARMHGHLCDGLVSAWMELYAALHELFPDGVIDRTDIRAVSKNGPCWVDAASWMTGARVNHGTLILDNSVGDGFIVQRISTGKAVRVSLLPGIYPSNLAELERSIRSHKAHGEVIFAKDIDRFEAEADAYSRRLLNTPSEHTVELDALPDFVFPDQSPNLIVPRSDIINRDSPRSGTPSVLPQKQDLEEKSWKP